MNYHRLNKDERYQIQGLIVAKQGVREIARTLGRSPSTISREIRRNRPNRILYRARKAHKRAKFEKSKVHRKLQIRGKHLDYVVNCLKNGWSPEQISGRLRRDGIKLTHETIYQFIYRNYDKEDGKLYLYLTHRRKKRRSHIRHRNNVKGGKTKNLPWIDERDLVVNNRERLGDFERDSIISPRRQGAAVLTIVDRKSRFTKIAKLETLESHEIHVKTLELLKGLPIKTITNDNGPEFAMYNWTSRMLKIPIYFSRPYCSWQRGTNENTNGLIRRYYPKGTKFDQVPEEDLQALEVLLNSRPRKCLDFRTPYEVQNE